MIDKGNDGERQVAVCLLPIENYPTETYWGRDTVEKRLRLKPGGAGICCCRSSHDEVTVEDYQPRTFDCELVWGYCIIQRNNLNNP